MELPGNCQLFRGEGVDGEIPGPVLMSWAKSIRSSFVRPRMESTTAVIMYQACGRRLGWFLMEDKNAGVMIAEIKVGLLEET